MRIKGHKRNHFGKQREKQSIIAVHAFTLAPLPALLPLKFDYCLALKIWRFSRRDLQAAGNETLGLGRD
jgi:hypothetical protein